MTNFGGQELILLPNEGDRKLVLPVGLDCQFIVSNAEGEDHDRIVRAEGTLDKLTAVLAQGPMSITDELLARVAGHMWTTSKGPGFATVVDYRTGAEYDFEDEPVAEAARALGEYCTIDLGVEVGYHPVPCFRHHVGHNSSVVNLCARGYSVRAYRTLFQGSGGLERRYEFGFSVRDAVSPVMLDALVKLAIAKP